MLFRITTTNPNVTKLRVKVRASRNLLYFLDETPSIALDNYIIKNYNMTLFEACEKILDSAIITKMAEEEVIVMIPNKKLSDLAQLITYGNRQVQGSNILKYALDLC